MALGFKYMKRKLDNRMEWIRNIDQLARKSASVYRAEYELASESYIPGILDYQNGAILCGAMTFDKGSNGLYKYLLKITYPYDDEAFSVRKANKKGYLFKGGIPGELISLLSFFFQCRFFLLSAYSGDLTSTGLKIKTEYTPQIGSCRPYFDPDMLPGSKRNFSIGLIDFLEKLSQIDAVYHQQIILGFHNYGRALREFGIDEEMVFIRLVSAIESFAKWVELDRRDDLFSGLHLDNIIKPQVLSADEKMELERIFDVRKGKYPGPEGQALGYPWKG